MLTTADYLFTVVAYVAFRSSSPDTGTWLQVLQNLYEYRIDVTQLVIFSTNHCP